MNKQEEIINERAREAVYRTGVVAKAAVPVVIAGSASFSWTGTGSPNVPAQPAGEMIGRVALDGPHALVPAGEFYVGTERFQNDRITVFNWRAPVARTFYQQTGHQLCSSVVGTRAFAHGNDSYVSDFEDERRDGVEPLGLFATRALTVPRAPERALPRVAAPIPPVIGDSEAGLPAMHPTARPTPPSKQGVRGRGLLEETLARPRGDKMASVLATLQPEQYDLVTRRGDEDLIVDGHPGTGKTVIAVHRAAYLVSDEYNEQAEDDSEVRKVLLVGPTDDYVSHVADSITRLTNRADNVKVLSVRQVLALASGLKSVDEGKAISKVEDGDEDLWRLAHQAVQILKTRTQKIERRDARVTAAYNILRTNGERGTAVTPDPDWQDYLRRLPTFDRARSMRNHTPLIAALGWSVQRTLDFHAFDHIIVDEAQDVMAVEWALLDALNRTERWTLLGDMNQRRSDAALGSWTHIANALGILDGDGQAPVTTMRRGYRSTAPIMAYANRLLPKAERDVESIQVDGPPVVVTRTSESELHDKAERVAGDLRKSHPSGTIAIIDVYVPVVEAAMRRANWQKSATHPHRWTKGAHAVDVLHPDRARGLEWDAVVVVEPALFPQNFLRHGLLYTSLTRANKELRVLHYKALPGPLGK